jgi:hypothetical protein
MRRKLFITIVISVVGYLTAVASSFNDTLITGTWKGTSLCQVKNSPCHDEIAVYHVSKGDKPGTYHFVMNKIVNGKEETMGALEYTYDATAGTLTNLDTIRKIIWKFKVKDRTMEGTLFYKKELYRIIKLSKEK